MRIGIIFYGIQYHSPRAYSKSHYSGDSSPTLRDLKVIIWVIHRLKRLKSHRLGDKSSIIAPRLPIEHYYSDIMLTFFTFLDDFCPIHIGNYPLYIGNFSKNHISPAWENGVLYIWFKSEMACCLSGNELSGNGVGTRVAANQYASDTISLRNLVQDIYSGVEPKPQIIAPGGFFDQNWFKEFLDKTTKSLDVITHHIYNLGPGTVPEETDSSHFLRHIELALFLKV